MKKTTKLSTYDNNFYRSGSLFKRVTWYCINFIIFNASLPFPIPLKVFLLRLYGGKVGSNVIIKPRVNIKYPWFLIMGNNVWVGEDVWIDNLGTVTIGDNVCLSQGCYLLTGNHNYKKVEFDLMVKRIILEDGVWIGAKAIVCPGTVCRSHSVLSVQSVAVDELCEYGIYQGNPATYKKNRQIL
jgi:putative colanic acid biosynthesis acetyltransferase WcaF